MGSPKLLNSLKRKAEQLTNKSKVKNSIKVQEIRKINNRV